MSCLLRHLWWLAPALVSGITYGAASFDWEELMMLSMGFAAIGYIIVDLKRTSKLDGLADEHRDRITKLELIWAYAAEKSDLDALEVRVENIATPSDLTQLADRVAVLSEHAMTHAERITTLEARADHRPWRPARKKNGTFAKPETEEGTT